MPPVRECADHTRTAPKFRPRRVDVGQIASDVAQVMTGASDLPARSGPTSPGRLQRPRFACVGHLPEHPLIAHALQKEAAHRLAGAGAILGRLAIYQLTPGAGALRE